ncbi:MAG: VWA domain-containing protein, partial [Bacteroidales bacterium]|nr:VWA domain-containing protein [Bacteroidales bacterium]
VWKVIHANKRLLKHPTTLKEYLSQIDDKSILQDLAGLFKLSISQVQNIEYYLPCLKTQITLTDEPANSDAILSYVQEIDPLLAWFSVVKLLLDYRGNIFESALDFLETLPLSNYPLSNVDIATVTDPNILKQVLLSHPDDAVKIAVINRSKELLPLNQLFAILIQGSSCFSEDVLLAGISAIDKVRSRYSIKFARNALWKQLNEPRPGLIEFYLGDVYEGVSPIDQSSLISHTFEKALKYRKSLRTFEIFSYLVEKKADLILMLLESYKHVSLLDEDESNTLPALLYGLGDYFKKHNGVVAPEHKKLFKSIIRHTGGYLYNINPIYRLAAFHCRMVLAPENVLGLAHQMLEDDDDEIQQLSLSLLKQHGREIDANHLITVLKNLNENPLISKNAALTEALLSLDMQKGFAAIIYSIVNCENIYSSTDSLRNNILLVLNKFVPPAEYRRSLLKLSESHVDTVRLLAFELLTEPFSKKELKNWAVKALMRPMRYACFSNREDSKREWALKVLEGETDPALLPLILPWAHYEVKEIRAQSLKTMIGIDDILVFSELVASLNDIEPEVQKIAENLLFETPEKVAILRRLNKMGKRDPVNEVREKVLSINRWAVGIAFALTGKRATISQYDTGIGRTWATGKHSMKIEISEKPVTTFHKYGEEIMRGIALHEIGHHLCDIGVRGARTMRGIANSEGCNEIFNILLDERLERVLRSKNPEWGIYFDRLSSYVFNNNTHIIPIYEIAKQTGKSVGRIKSKLLNGELPGVYIQAIGINQFDSIRLRDIELLTFPYPLVSINMVFLTFARCGFAASLHSDPRVKEAISMIPANLKDLRHADVLKVAKQIAGILGIGATDEFRNAREESKKKYGRFREGEISNPYPNNTEETPQLTSTIQKILQRVDEIMHNLDMDNGKVRNTPTSNPYKNCSGKGIKVNDINPTKKHEVPESDAQFGQFLNIGDSIDFDLLEKTVCITSEPEQDAELILPLRNHVIRLRSFFENLSRSEQDEYASRRGKRLDHARMKKALVAPGLNILVSSTQHNIKSDAYIGILIDKSSSMHGEKLTLAKSFAALLVESIGAIHGIEGHVNAFDDDTFYTLGTLKHCTVAGLHADGGNNDAGALLKAAGLAMASGKRNKLLVMISDGSPTGCTEKALTNLVQQLERANDIKCVQVAVDKIDTASFRDFVDLSNLNFHNSIARFGEIIARITAEWR